MQAFEDIRRIRAARWEYPELSWGLVPTMGAFHKGHVSLIRRAKKENDRVGVSIYVNPAQFGPAEDLKKYPRDMDRDLELLKREGVDLVWTPTDPVIYPEGYQTYVTCERPAERLEGASRPTHFRGVCTIVTKLFHVFDPRRAYFGQKDAQQAVIIQRIVKDLNFNLEIVVCPTIREKDGLAMSSRNRYLSPEERKAASILHSSLTSGLALVKRGERSARKIKDHIIGIIEREPLARLDYVSISDPESLEELDTILDEAIILLAAFIGRTRLIDNIMITRE